MIKCLQSIFINSYWAGFDSLLIDILTGKNYGQKRHQMLIIYFNYLESLVYKNFSKYIFLKDILYDEWEEHYNFLTIKL